MTTHLMVFTVPGFDVHTACGAVANTIEEIAFTDEGAVDCPGCLAWLDAKAELRQRVEARGYRRVDGAP